jgi:CBS domain-containing protein
VSKSKLLEGLMEGYKMSGLEERIKRAASIPELRSLREEMVEKFPAPPALLFIGQWYDQLNRLHDHFIRRTLILSERRLREEGMGSPPVPYAYVLVGSGGRAEQTQWSDQDNGLVYAEPSVNEAEKTEQYYQELSEVTFQALREIGYPPCEGNVISTNPQWRKSVSDWERMLQGWFSDPQWENVRYLLIAVDMRCVHGDESLVETLKNAIHHEVKKRPLIMGDMLRNTLHHKPSLGPFGNLITERYGLDAGGLDIKYGAYIPLINGIRLLSVEGDVQYTSSLQRIEALKEQGFIEQEIGLRWKEALQFTLWLRTQTPFQLENGIYSTRGILQEEQLDRELKQRLRRALRSGQELQTLVKKRIERLLSEYRTERGGTQ